MEIMPNSTIKFLRNIPFDNDYNDTIYFDNPQQQANYFSDDKFTKYTIENQMYTRHSEGKINVQIPFERVSPSSHEHYESSSECLLDCNYMMFKNNSFKYKDPDDGFYKTKWFYAFITEVEYVNNEVARVTFEIDVMQTWMFDYDLEQCFIEREHSATDVIGENVVEENLDIGKTYITEKVVNKLAEFDEMDVVCLAGKNHDGTYPEVMWFINNIPTTLVTSFFNLHSEAEDFLVYYQDFTSNQLTNLTPDDIVVMYLFPTQRSEILPAGKGIIDGDIVSITRPNSFHYLTPTNQGNFYSPKNKKLLTFPFIGLEVSNHEGTTELYQYENFINSGVSPVFEFKIKACNAPSPAMVIYPLKYLPSQKRGAINSDNDGYDYGIAITDFQQCAWVGDAFKAWWAQNKASFVSSTTFGALGGMAAVGAGLAMSNPALGLMSIVGGLISIGKTVGNAAAKVEDIKHQPNTVKGLSNTLSLPISMNYFGYSLRSKTITGEYARIVDDYFSMFGYATHRVKTPNIHVREKWTYTQTIGCTIKGRLPSKYQEKICKIFDKGIRFWDKDADVGVYRDTYGELFANRCLAEISQ